MGNSILIWIQVCNSLVLHGKMVKDSAPSYKCFIFCEPTNVFLKKLAIFGVTPSAIHIRIRNGFMIISVFNLSFTDG